MNPYAKTKVEAIDAFERALLGVAPTYFATSLPDGSVAFGERVFAYELYHQMRLTFSGAWYVHGEFRKGLRVLPQLNSNRVLNPDLVVHQPDTISENLLAIEIKTTPTLTGPELLRDFNKLDFYTMPQMEGGRGGLDFQIGVMVIANLGFEELYGQFDESSRRALSSIARRAPRVAIWNIPKPIALEGDNEGRLNRGCLNVFRADWSGW